MSKIPIRDVAPIIQVFRNFLLGREHNLCLRSATEIAQRTQPPPKLPPGPYSKLSKNYYYTRDARREVGPALLIADNAQVRQPLAAGQGKDQETAALAPTFKKPVTPGPTFQWDAPNQ